MYNSIIILAFPNSYLHISQGERIDGNKDNYNTSTE